MLTRDGTHRYVIHTSTETEAALNALREFTEWTEQEGYTDTGDLWERCNDLYRAITGGENLPGFDPTIDEGDPAEQAAPLTIRITVEGGMVQDVDLPPSLVGMVDVVIDDRDGEG